MQDDGGESVGVPPAGSGSRPSDQANLRCPDHSASIPNAPVGLYVAIAIMFWPAWLLLYAWLV